jgi:uncharacterized protein YecE (DUF72 family)
MSDSTGKTNAILQRLPHFYSPQEVGPLLLQLPPSFDRSAANRRALSAFLELIPIDQVRLAIELRHPAWAELLRLFGWRRR